MAEKLELKKERIDLYRPSTKGPVLIEVPEMAFLMIDGAGNPNTHPDYQAAVEALYGTAYTIKFACKKALGRDFVVMPLEGLWWGMPLDKAVFTEADKDQFQWTMMIRQPDFVTPEMVTEAASEAARKKDLPALPKLRFELYAEGMAVQSMHIGPYDAEGPLIRQMHQFALDSGYHLHGKHHEIYLGDPRRTAPEKLKTVLRQPVRRSVIDKVI